MRVISYPADDINPAPRVVIKADSEDDRAMLRAFLRFAADPHAWTFCLHSYGGTIYGNGYAPDNMCLGWRAAPPQGTADCEAQADAQWHAHRLEQWLKRLAWLLGLGALVVIGLYYAVQVMSPHSPLLERSPSRMRVVVDNISDSKMRCFPVSMGTPTGERGFLVEPGEKVEVSAALTKDAWQCVALEPVALIEMERMAPAHHSQWLE